MEFTRWVSVLYLNVYVQELVISCSGRAPYSRFASAPDPARPRSLGQAWVAGYDHDGMAAKDDAAARRRADTQLVTRVLRGDGRAEAALLDTILPHLRAVARTILTNPADVDDAVQVALMRVLEGLSGFRGESSLVRWCRRVAAHACLRQREQNQRRLRVVELGADAEAVGAPVPEPRLGEGLPRHIAEYLDRLPQKQREALVLRHVLDYGVSEVAELVGAPVDTVKSRLRYARRAMRDLISRDAARASTTSVHGGAKT